MQVILRACGALDLEEIYGPAALRPYTTLLANPTASGKKGKGGKIGGKVGRSGGEENALLSQEGEMEMSMYPQELASIPAETVRVARAAYPKGTLAMRLRDELGAISRDEQFTAVFARQTCAACPCRADGTQSQTTGRVLHMRPQAAQEALLARRQEQETPAFRQRYAIRAGVEGTLSQAVRVMGLRRARSVGLAKTHFQHLLTAVALNVVRIDAVFTQTPRGQIRHSALSRLASHPTLTRSVA